MRIICMFAFIIAYAACDANAADRVDQLLGAHENGLAAVHSVELEYSVAVRTSIGAAPELMSKGEWLMDGLLERHLENSDVTYDSKGDRNPDGWAKQLFGLDDRHVRIIQPMRKDMNLELLVTRGVKAGDADYLALRCDILARNPLGTFRPVHQWFRRVVNSTMMLRQVVEAGRLSNIETIGDDEVIELFVNDGGPVGEYLLRVFLDKSHGYAMRRTEYVIGTGENLRKNVIEIDEFAGDESAWFPARTITSNGVSEVIATANRLLLNQPIAPSRLKLNFPEGARVDEPSAGLVHTWGEGDKPARSVSAAEFSRAESDVAGGGVVAKARTNLWTIVLLNVLGIAVIILLGFWRRTVAVRRERSGR